MDKPGIFSLAICVDTNCSNFFNLACLAASSTELVAVHVMTKKLRTENETSLVSKDLRIEKALIGEGVRILFRSITGKSGNLTNCTSIT